jgi:hypothetical protein
MKNDYCKFEYDINFYGGDYNDVGEFVLINWNLIDEFGHELAFEKATGLSRVHIIHYIINEALNKEDDPLEFELNKIFDNVL